MDINDYYIKAAVRETLQNQVFSIMNDNGISPSDMEDALTYILAQIKDIEIHDLLVASHEQPAAAPAEPQPEPQPEPNVESADTQDKNDTIDNVSYEEVESE
jgi:ribosomal protein L12E/L44/L45/RPP1/RPP2